jgi:hypothetical protein
MTSFEHTIFLLTHPPGSGTFLPSEELLRLPVSIFREGRLYSSNGVKTAFGRHLDDLDDMERTSKVRFSLD